MSEFNGHLGTGLLIAGTTAIAAGVFLPTAPVVVYVGTFLSTLVFSLFPDLDVKSKPSQIFYSAFLLYLLMLYVMKQHTLAHISAIFAVLPQIPRHRGIFHHPITAILIPSYPMLVYSKGYMDLHVAVMLSIAGIAGYFTHLFLDSK